jgi:hypothetical protein
MILAHYILWRLAPHGPVILIYVVAIAAVLVGGTELIGRLIKYLRKKKT